MSFASPLWLLALIPWAALTVWLLVARNPHVTVPFIALWQDQDTPKRSLAQRRLQLPPVALACVLMAMLLSLLAAAQPFIARGKVRIQIIVDHGVTMSGRTPEEKPWSAVLAEVRSVAQESEVEGDQSPTGLNTQDELIARAKAISTQRDVAVISNQDLGSTVEEPRIVRASIGPRENVGIVRVAVRETPRVSVMLRLRNESKLSRATVTLDAAPASPQMRDIELAATGTERDYFFDLEQLGPVVLVDVVADDELRADNRAWLVRERSAARIENRVAVSPELARIIDVYSRHRLATENATSIAIVDAEPLLGVSEVGVVVPSSGEKLDANSPVQVSDHPVVSNVRDWGAALRDATVARPSGEGWTPIVKAGDRVLVAVRDGAVRQTWVGFNSAAFARSTDFVIFWTDVFDWLGSTGAAEFRTHPVSRLDSSWQRDVERSGEPSTASPAPGLYRQANGEHRAMSAVDLRFDQAAQSHAWRDKLEGLVKNPRDGAVTNLARPVLIAALVLIAMAALFCGRNRVPKITAATRGVGPAVPTNGPA